MPGAFETIGPVFALNDWLHRTFACSGSLPSMKYIDVNYQWNVKGGATRTKAGPWALVLFRNDPGADWVFNTSISVDGVVVDTRSSVSIGDIVVGPCGNRPGTWGTKAEQPVPRIIVSKDQLVLTVTAGTNTGNYWAEYVMVKLG